VGRAAAAEHHPEVDTGVHMMLVIDCAAWRGHAAGALRLPDARPGQGRHAAGQVAGHHGHEGAGRQADRTVCKRLKVPTECRDLAMMTAREHGNVSRA
jgi:tRNA nucleotidyltransferase (CCA-adding enzyme)